MVWFTSDLHLGHNNIIRSTNRPFNSVEEMNGTLIRNINNKVQINDDLWILGDFAYRVRKNQVIELRNRIRCKNVHLVIGNHDKDYSNDNGVFSSIQYYKELKTEYGPIILFHYPIASWNKAHYGSIHLHGHIHSNGEYNLTNINKKIIYPNGNIFYRRIYDVGVDANGYFPINLESIVNLMNVDKM